MASEVPPHTEFDAAAAPPRGLEEEESVGSDGNASEARLEEPLPPATALQCALLALPPRATARYDGGAEWLGTKLAEDVDEGAADGVSAGKVSCVARVACHFAEYASTSARRRGSSGSSATNSGNNGSAAE